MVRRGLLLTSMLSCVAMVVLADDPDRLGCPAIVKRYADIFPGALAEGIALEVNAFRLTGERRYLLRADALARIAVQWFLDDGKRPLPKSSVRRGHYETITDSPNMILQLLDLWAAQQEPPRDLKIEWTKR